MQEALLWEKFKKYYYFNEKLGFSLDISRIKFDEQFIADKEKDLKAAFNEMQKLESGAIANPDENRMVGHYWLRTPELSPDLTIRKQIEDTIKSVKDFASDVRSGKILTQNGDKFEYILLIGIGGSALGPQFLNKALFSPKDQLKIFFFDNTDPDGMQREIASIPDPSRCLSIVISKSGGTKETRNGMLVAEAAYKARNLDFTKSVCAVTGENSELDKVAVKNNWLKRFPMFDWIGGRTSELSAVGLLPAALQGFNIDELLKGASDMDAETRKASFNDNPAARLATMWFKATEGKGKKDMVILPYNDRLELLANIYSN